MRVSRLIVLFVTVLAVDAGAARAVASEPPTGQVAGASEWHDPTSLDEVASMVRHRLKDIRTCLDASAVAAVHTDAWDVARLARAAPALAEKEAASLPVGGVAAVSKSAEELARSADRLHTLADAENVKEAVARFDEVSSRLARSVRSEGSASRSYSSSWVPRRTHFQRPWRTALRVGSSSPPRRSLHSK